MENEKLEEVKEELDKLLGDDEKSLLLDLVLQLKHNSEKHSTSIEKLEGIKKEIWATGKITTASFDTLLKAFVQFKLPEVYPVLIKNSIKLEKPDWFTLAPVIEAIKVIAKQATQIQKVSITETNDPTHPVAVRLSDGKRFYTAILQAFSTLGGKFTFTEDGKLRVDAEITVEGSSEVEVINDSENPVPVEITNPFTLPSEVEITNEEGNPIPTEVTNFPTTIDIGNFPSSFEVSNFPTTIDIGNFPTSFEVSNFPSSFEVFGEVSVSNFPSFPSSFEVSNFPTDFPDSATLTELGNILTELIAVKDFVASIDGKDFATETTLASVLAAVDTLETKLQSIIENTDGLEGFTDGLEGLLTEIKGFVDGLEGFVDGLEGFVDGLETLLTTLNAKDFATEATLATRSTEATLLLVKGVLDLIKAKTDNLNVALSTRASEATLALIKAKTDNLDVALSTRLAEATFTGTLGEVQAVPTAYTVLGRLKNIEGSLLGVLNEHKPLLRENLLTYTNEFVSTLAGVIASQTILTPPSGKKISVKLMAISTESIGGAFNLDFLTSPKIALRFYPTANSGGINDFVTHIGGAVDEVLTVSGTGLGNAKKTYLNLSYEFE